MSFNGNGILGNFKRDVCAVGDKIRKIAVFTGNRAEYGLLHPVIVELLASQCFDVYLIISGTHLSEDFGQTISEISLSNVQHVVKIDITSGIDQKVSDGLFMLKSFSKLISDAGPILSRIQPEIIVLAGDRYETFAMAITAYYMNIPIAHLFGGDLSQGGHLDDSVRHSLTKLAHLHFTSNDDSYERVLNLGEEKWRVFKVGSTSIDNIESGSYATPDEIAEELKIDIDKPVILFTQHPVTTESEFAYDQVKESLEALKELNYQTVITYPCNDNGSHQIIEAIEEYSNIANFRIRKSLGWKLYLGLMRISSAVVGNSSSGITDTPILKVPCVNIGSRQKERLRAENVIDAPYDKNEIIKAIKRALYNEIFLKILDKSVNPYGSDGASKIIVEKLKSIRIDKSLLQKKITY